MNPLELFVDTRPEFTIAWRQKHQSVIRATDIHDAARMLTELCYSYDDAHPHSVEKIEKVRSE